MDTVQHTPIVKSRGGPTAVQAIQAVPGLRVYELPVELRGLDIWHWRVGHHGGLAIASAASSADALEVAEAIADFTDWTRSASDLQADARLDVEGLSVRINCSTPGRFLHR
ncbi:hypothetical protein ACIOUE_00745 [Streptomyces xanthochromogenes]|uniref:hypothetical protein n=1 Tax=Streptomyces xanthochromogenes TaxID=67384 RepID=UPI0037F8ED3E